MTADNYNAWAPANFVEFWTMVIAIGTVATFFATGAVAWVAKLGLNALGLSKKDMKTRATRDARVCAIERCKEMAGTIIPMMADVRTATATAKIPLFAQSLAQVRFDEMGERAALSRANVWVAAIDQKIRNDLIHALNAHEAWAMYFNHELAELVVASEPCGSVFLQNVMYLYGAAILARASAPSGGKYANTVKLFDLWYHQMKSEGKAKELEELSDEVERLNSMGPKPPTPLGLAED